METKQKILLWISLVMFIIPEILFSFIFSSTLFLFRVNISYLMGKLIGEQFFIDNQFIIFCALIVEILGLLGLLIFNIKFNQNKSRLILSIILFILLIFTILIFYTAFYMRHGMGF
jgi:hypothetical protein